MRAIFFALFVLLAGCKSNPILLAEQEKLVCSANGGNIVRYTKTRIGCEWLTNDAEKICSDDSECEGYCQAATDRYSSLSGKCSSKRGDTKVPICALHFSDGKLIVNSCNN